MGASMNAHYFAGLLVGEGSFTIDMSKDSRLTIGLRMRPSVRISMADVDSEMLRAVVEELGFGNILTRQKKEGYDQISISFRSKEDVTNLIEIVEVIAEENKPFRKSHKYKCFKRWKPVAKALIRGEHTQDKEKAKDLIDRAHNVNKKFGGHGKGAAHWKNIVDESG